MFYEPVRNVSRLRRTLLSFVACPFLFQQAVSLLYGRFIHLLAVLPDGKALHTLVLFTTVLSTGPVGDPVRL
jgi:hypothetical protein